MIIRLKLADFSENNIGKLDSYYISLPDVEGVSYGNTAKSVKIGDPYTNVITVADGYTLTSLVIKMGGTDISSAAITDNSDGTYNININSVTGTVTVGIIVRNESTGEEDDGGEGNGVWLSELITGDSNAHSAFMAVPNHTATISTTPDYIYHTSAIQSLLSGKTITRVACANLAPGTTITFYSNPWSTGTLTKDGRTEIGTITGASSAQTAGTSMATYIINASVKLGESLAFKVSSGVRMVDYGQLDFVTPVKYAYNKDTYDSTLGEFIAFDFYLEG